MSGPAAVRAIGAMEDLPRRNGELVFDAPWQGRAFGLGVALCERGYYEWGEFQRSLIATVNAVDPAGSPGRSYYEQWLEALQQLLVDRGLLSREEIERRTEQLRSGEREPD